MIKTPFYPQRPLTGPKLTPDNILQVTSDYVNRGYVLQRKLNGSRGILESTKQGLKLWNRYCSVFAEYNVNLNPWLGLPVGTILDGECYRGEFRCFEVVTTGLCDCTQEGASHRINGAEQVCRQFNQPYVFGGITNDWLCGEVMLTANKLTRMWEGVVAKLATAKYTPLKKDHQESPTWERLKWC